MWNFTLKYSFIYMHFIYVFTDIQIGTSLRIYIYIYLGCSYIKANSSIPFLILCMFIIYCMFDCTSLFTFILSFAKLMQQMVN